MRASWKAYGLAVAAAFVGAAPAHAAAVTTTPVKIPASQPDDRGAAVVLDGGVTAPSEGCPCPGIIINHGFLGRWQDSQRITEQLAAAGYVVLRYSSRGFGETPGEVDLMGPKETRDLLDAVDWLDAHPLVQRNRIGQFGGSYGGAHAWALAASGHRAVRTTVPTATWTDIYDALLPNGVMLLAYANGFYASGFGPTGWTVSGGDPTADDNYSQNLHRWMAQVNSGAGVEDAKAGMAERSVATDYGRVKVPVFIVQGLNDGLFSANQAIEAYQALAAKTKQRKKARPRLYLGGVGHPPSDGSLDSPEATYVGNQVLAWFDHHLKGIENGIDELPPIEFSRADYFHNRWDRETRTAERYPFGAAKRMHLCTSGPSGGALAAQPCPQAPAAVATNANAGAGYDQEPVTAGYAEDFKEGFAEYLGSEVPDLTTVPTVLTYDGPVLDAPLDLAGIPELRLRVAAADVLPAGVEPATAAAFQLDPKLYDVAPDGTAKLLTRGAFAQPLASVAPGVDTIPAHDVAFDAFGLSNRIPAGHRLRITLQTSDAPYLRPTPNPFAVALLAGSAVELPGVGGPNVSARSRKVERCSRIRRGCGPSRR